nr:glycosyltransferase family 4 protein [Candidatus Dependentiae bacterium]
QKKYNVGLIGRFTSEKGHKYLINAADLIINKYNFKNINFKFIGNDNFGISVLGDIKKNIAEYNLEKYFEFTGYVESIVEYINDNLDVIVIPSEREAFGRVVLESWIAEKPVIAFEIEGLAELIENNKTGILVKKNNVIELAEKIMYIINNQHAAKNIVLSGKEEIKKFDISFSSENILKVWEEIII